MHVRRRLSTVGVVLLAGLLSGCRTGTHLLFFTTYTKVGLDISAVNGTPTQALFGYKRFEGAIVPVDPPSAFDPVHALEALEAKAEELKQQANAEKNEGAKADRLEQAEEAQATATTIRAALEAWIAARKSLADKATALAEASTRSTAKPSEEGTTAVAKAKQAWEAAESDARAEMQALERACRGNANQSEVMSVYAAIKASNGWLKGLKINQAFATGEAAKTLAADSEVIETVIEAK